MIMEVPEFINTAPRYLSTLMRGLYELSDEPRDTFDDLFGQWEHAFGDSEDTGSTNEICLCSQKGLRYIYFINNVKNGNRTHIGSVCIDTVRESIDNCRELDRIVGAVMQSKKHVKSNLNLFDPETGFDITLKIEKQIGDNVYCSYTFGENDKADRAKLKKVLLEKYDSFRKVNPSTRFYLPFMYYSRVGKYDYDLLKIKEKYTSSAFALNEPMKMYMREYEFYNKSGTQVCGVTAVVMFE